MYVRFEWFKLACGTIAVIGVFVFAVIGVQTFWTDYVVKDYDKHLVERVYVDVAVNQNVNLVFYKKGCPYCEAGKKAVILEAEKSASPTFYIDVESEAGQTLVKRYQVKKAATLITIRDGKPQLYHYAVKDKTGQIEADQKTIKEAFND